MNSLPQKSEHSVAPTVLLLPGWQNSGYGHWQTRWEALHGDTRVQQSDWQRPLRGDWMARLDETLLALPQHPHRPVLLAAHSLGCHLAAAWAAHSHQTARVSGALLVAPPDVTRPDLPPDLHNWRRPVLARLPFAATLLYSTDDPYAGATASQGMARAWGSAAVSLGNLGHVNGDSGLGDWADGRRWLLDLMPTPHAGMSPS